MDKLIWEKYRPKQFDELVLLPRIREEFKDGINQHYIFYGHFGTGKTSLARILVDSYGKSVPVLELNCSINTSIDVLRDDIETFCKSGSMFHSSYEYKYVILDEFDRVSIQFQDAFKAFMEKYNTKVRFIIITNHINRVSDGIKSRTRSICFDIINPDERLYLIKSFYTRIKEQIIPAENIQISDNDLKRIIVKKFPDFRNVLVELQSFSQSGYMDIANTNTEEQAELYHLIFSKETTADKVYDFLMSSFGAERIHEVFGLLSRPLIDWARANGVAIDQRFFMTSDVLARFVPQLESSIDPIILGMNVIGHFNAILK